MILDPIYKKKQIYDNIFMRLGGVIMAMMLEKFYRIVQDINNLRYPKREVVERYKIIYGKEKGSAQVKHDEADWLDYTTGELWAKGKNQHCWFRTTVTIPLDFSGEKVLYTLTTGHKEGWDISNPQFCIYVNGELIQGLDVNHKEIVLSESVKGGEAFQITLLGHSGLEDAAVFIESSIKTVDKKIEAFYYDFSNLFWTACSIIKNETERIELFRQLDVAIQLLDLRKSYSKDFYQGLDKATQLLKEQYYKKIREEGPVVSVLGHTHIDIAWLWTTSQTREKVVRSFSTVLQLMEIYPEYIFMSSQPQLYVYLKEEAPKLYEQVKARVKEGRWEIDGGMWLEADCNIPSGESLSRQLLYGISFIKEAFDQDCKTLWLPDVFGCSGALPQLIKKSGLSYFMTTKLDWNQFNKMPNDTFIWRGIDGTEVLTHFITTCDYVKFEQGVYGKEIIEPQTTYNGLLTPNQVLGTWTRYKDKLLSDNTLQIFGYGDGGGGPTKDMLENYQRLKYGLPGLPKVQMVKQRAFFERLEDRSKDNRYLKKWQGELYFENHRGTYTSMAKNKRYNRKSEILYQDIEFLSTMAKAFDYTYPKTFIKKSWEKILLNQFHDIIPGTSIKEVYEETDLIYEKLGKEGALYCQQAMACIAKGLSLRNDSVIVFNTLSHERTDIIEIENNFVKELVALKDTDGKIYPVYMSKINNHRLFLASNIPSKGYKIFECIYGKGLRESGEERCLNREGTYGVLSNHLKQDKATHLYFENQHYELVFNQNLELESIYDRLNERELLKEDGRGNVLQLFDDRPLEYENWNVDCYYQDKMYEIQNVEKLQVVEHNPLRTCIEISRKYQDSTIKQTIIMYNHHARIDFKTEVDWHEQHVLLKVAFDVDINATQATYEIQYGSIQRTTHENTSWDRAQFEVCGHKWADISETGYGISLMNDCKYGYDIKQGVMRQTLIKCGTYPNEEADQGYHEFTYSIYGHKDCWQNAKTQTLASELNVPLRYHYIKGESKDKMSEKTIGSYSFVQVLNDNIIIDTIKEHETTKGTIIRVYEYKNSKSKSYIKTGQKIHSVYLCDLIENIEMKLEHDAYGFNIAIKPFEVLTYLVNFEEL